MSIIDIAKAAIFTPAHEDKNGDAVWGLPICFWGPPGAGKTYRLSGETNKWELYLEVLSPGERGEGAFGVTPVPSAGNKSLNYPPADWVIELELAGGGVLFLDEINQAPPPLQPALQGILLGRRIGGHKLNNHVRPIAAANPTEQAAGGWDFAPPVANRMGHLAWPGVDAEEWSDWLLGIGGPKEETTTFDREEKRVLAAWAEPWARERAIIAGFMRAKPELLHKMPEMGNPQLHKAWPSPRTWEMAARASAGAVIHRLSAADRETFIGGFVGDGAAGELFNYAAKLDLPAPSDVLDGKVAFKHEPRRLDRSVAILGACHALVLNPTCEKRKERIAKLWSILGDAKLLDNAMDVAFPSIKALVLAKLHQSTIAYAILGKVLPQLRAAGISFDPNAKPEDD